MCKDEISNKATAIWDVYVSECFYPISDIYRLFELIGFLEP